MNILDLKLKQRFLIYKPKFKDLLCTWLAAANQPGLSLLSFLCSSCLVRYINYHPSYFNYMYTIFDVIPSSSALPSNLKVTPRTFDGLEEEYDV